MLLGDIVGLNAARSPDRVAVEDAGRIISYGLLHQRVNRLANALLGVANPGDRVAILAQNIPEYIECYYGAPSAGMVLTLLNYRLHEREWAYILNDSGARVLIVDTEYLDRVESILADVPAVKEVVVIGNAGRGVVAYEDFLAAASAARPSVSVDEHDSAWLIYTSGTTGFPKGAMLTHHNLLTSALQNVIEYQPASDDRHLMSFPLCHVAGNLVLVNQIRGGALHLMKAFEPDAWTYKIEQQRITTSSVAPTMAAYLISSAGFCRRDLSSLIGLGYGSAVMPVDTLRTLIDRLGPIVWSGFGMTELGGNVLSHPKEAHIRALAGEEHLLRACGRPMCLADVQVVDGDLGFCLPGEVGEIVIRGEQVTKGYWGNEKATAAALEGGWFHTGDLARRDDEGYFYIVDRLKDMIISGGENVYSREVEDAILGLDGVAEVAVIGLADEEWGERVTAVIVPEHGTAVTEETVIEHCRRQLARFKAPKTVLFADELPRTVSGKVRKAHLRSAIEQGGPGQVVGNPANERA